jgi:hypothetical protein
MVVGGGGGSTASLQLNCVRACACELHGWLVNTICHSVDTVMSTVARARVEHVRKKLADTRTLHTHTHTHTHTHIRTHCRHLEQEHTLTVRLVIAIVLKLAA